MGLLGLTKSKVYFLCLDVSSKKVLETITI